MANYSKTVAKNSKLVAKSSIKREKFAEVDLKENNVF